LRSRSGIRIRATGKATATHPHHRGDWPSTSRPSMDSRVAPISGTDGYHSAWQCAGLRRLGLHPRRLGGSGCALADLGCAFVAAVCTVRARGLRNTTIKQQKAVAAAVAEVAAAAQRRRRKWRRKWRRKRRRQRKQRRQWQRNGGSSSMGRGSGSGSGSTVVVALAAQRRQQRTARTTCAGAVGDEGRSHQ
jgi:hypothetical protein